MDLEVALYPSSCPFPLESRSLACPGNCWDVCLFVSLEADLQTLARLQTLSGPGTQLKPLLPVVESILAYGRIHLELCPSIPKDRHTHLAPAEDLVEAL